MGFVNQEKGALELNSRERDGTDLKAYEDIMEAPEEGKQGPVLRQQWEIVEQCAPNNVQADVVMEMECSLGGLKDFSISTNGVGDPEHDKALHEVHTVDDEEIPSIVDEVEAAGGEHLQLAPGLITQFFCYSEHASETHPVSKIQDEVDEEFLIGIIGCEEGRAPHEEEDSEEEISVESSRNGVKGTNIRLEVNEILEEPAVFLHVQEVIVEEILNHGKTRATEGNDSFSTDYLDEEGGDSRDCTEEEAVDVKEQIIRGDRGAETEFMSVRSVEEKVRAMIHNPVEVVLSLVDGDDNVMIPRDISMEREILPRRMVKLMEENSMYR